MEENNSWLQAKVAAQKVALDVMHSRVVRQRLQRRRSIQQQVGYPRQPKIAIEAAGISEESVLHPLHGLPQLILGHPASVRSGLRRHVFRLGDDRPQSRSAVRSLGDAERKDVGDTLLALS